MCDFLSMTNILEAAVEDRDYSDGDTECEFTIRVRPQKAHVQTAISSEGQDSASLKSDSHNDFSVRSAAAPSKPAARPYYLRASCKAERNMWIRDINTAVLAFKVAQMERKQLHESYWAR